MLNFKISKKTAETFFQNVKIIPKVFKSRNSSFSKGQNYSTTVQKIDTQVFQKIERIPKLIIRSELFIYKCVSDTTFYSEIIQKVKSHRNYLIDIKSCICDTVLNI